MPVGTEAQQLARLSHAGERHGLTFIECECSGEKPDCVDCGGTGWSAFWPAERQGACGPACPLLDVRPV